MTIPVKTLTLSAVSGPRQICRSMVLSGAMIFAGVTPCSAETDSTKVTHGTADIAHAGTDITYHTPVRIPGIEPDIVTGPLINNGGPVQTAPKVYVVFWGWKSDPSGEAPYLTKFLSSVGGTQWLNTVIQYGGGNPTDLYGGSWSDPTSIPAQPTDSQIQAEAKAAISHFGLSTSVNSQIIIATPTGHSTSGFGSSFCAYHGRVTAHPNVTYTNLPYMTDADSSCGAYAVQGLLDGVSIVEGHELAETITDPLVNSNDAWLDSGGNEIGDKCAWYELSSITTANGSFAVQPLWSNAANTCVKSTVIVTEVPVYRFYNGTHHFFTLSYSEGVGAGYGYEGIGFKVFKTQQNTGMYQLYRCLQQSTGDHFISVLSNCEGQNYEGPYGWVSSVSGSGLHALYRFYNQQADHLETTNYAEGANLGWSYEGILGYVPIN